MDACCVFCYEKFRDKDGALVQQIWDKLMREYEEDNNKPYPFNPCTCQCHNEGSQIIH